ncbi:hypothetical protein B0H19DRAFT_1261422 [Mycena capillaripes]|nr:hypothetical protein B0H19DRAFT_1261422 [Mycena capillaripes]
MDTTYIWSDVHWSAFCDFVRDYELHAVLFIHTNNNKSFQGVLTLQAYIYYESFSKDHTGLKLLVASVWFLDVAHLVLICQSCYHYLITNWGDNAALLVSMRELDLHLVFVGMASAICQGFFLSRLLAVACLIVYLATPHTFIFIAMHFSLGRMYTNALLATNLRKVLDDSGSVGPHTGTSLLHGVEVTNNTLTSEQEGPMLTQRSRKDVSLLSS